MSSQNSTNALYSDVSKPVLSDTSTPDGANVSILDNANVDTNNTSIPDNEDVLKPRSVTVCASSTVSRVWTSGIFYSPTPVDDLRASIFAKISSYFTWRRMVETGLVHRSLKTLGLVIHYDVLMLKPDVDSSPDHLHPTKDSFGTDPIPEPAASLRELEWGVNNYALDNSVWVTHPNPEVGVFRLYGEYQKKTNNYKRELFDPFCRGPRICFDWMLRHKKTGECILASLQTCVPQLWFHYWAETNGVLSYIQTHIGAIRSHMQMKTKNHREKEKARRLVLHKTSPNIPSQASPKSSTSLSSVESTSITSSLMDPLDEALPSIKKYKRELCARHAQPVSFASIRQPQRTRLTDSFTTATTATINPPLWTSPAIQPKFLPKKD